MSDDSKNKISLDRENAGKSLMQLILALVNLIKDLMEKQALYRIESGNLTEDQVEDLGATLMKLDEKLKELREDFDLTEEDIELDLSKYINVK
jgi:hypothetical protein